jgi:hypothetical protein
MGADLWQEWGQDLGLSKVSGKFMNGIMLWVKSLTRSCEAGAFRRSPD